MRKLFYYIFYIFLKNIYNEYTKKKISKIFHEKKGEKGVM